MKHYLKPLIDDYQLEVNQGFVLSGIEDDDFMNYENGGDAWEEEL
mgnify:CR=1 FL=1